MENINMGFSGGMGNMGNMMGMMQKAQKLQKEMEKMQKDLKDMTFKGSSAGSSISVEIKGNGTATKLEIDESLIDPKGKEDLQDLIIVAFNDAKEAQEKYSEDKTKQIMGDLKLPAGFKLPF
jgi:hypothetical protein